MAFGNTYLGFMDNVIPPTRQRSNERQTTGTM